MLCEGRYDPERLSRNSPVTESSPFNQDDDCQKASQVPCWNSEMGLHETSLRWTVDANPLRSIHVEHSLDPMSDDDPAFIVLGRRVAEDYRGVAVEGFVDVDGELAEAERVEIVDDLELRGS